MPPRSYYNSPRASDYIAFARAYFPDEQEQANSFVNTYNLPYISSSHHIAAYLGISSALVRQIMHNPNYHYRVFPIQKSSGDPRMISTPKTYLKVMQWWINDNILNKIQLSESVHGFRKGKSYITNARVHFGARHILNVDIKSFFDNITTPQIANVFSSIGYCESGSLTLAALTSKQGKAPTGAPTSPMIANAIFLKADEQLIEFARSKGLRYTRYADDLTFSSDHRIDEEVVGKVNAIVKSSGFQLNDKKTKFMGPGDRQEVTGIIINERMNLSKEWRNFARGYIHSILSNPSGNIQEMGRLLGIYGVLLQVDQNKESNLTKNAYKAIRILKDTEQTTTHAEPS
ncbi:RNA-directed DNA polymerase [Brucella anthropi]|uniref:reverse transcriptase domain-containing protein n=1 Tax=Brucella anthropi TaxID=529 RepID=UPI00124BDEC0|nr:reverse transcriptase domain-containing protein [Brucella anthropi]KAB2790410.1 RNA-directed DNA polymerase [Brucella anthropi]QOD62733.1 RNA-directed DNA polymerase [Ochrobactrum sp. MT180101]